MAGISNGRFCRKMSSYGFDMLTLGGYSADDISAEAGRKILQRGRPEFDTDPSKLPYHIENEVKFIRNGNPWDGLVSVNLRAVSPEPLIPLSKLDCVDVVEINAHCRQPELVESGCGQSLLTDTERLHAFISHVVKKGRSKVSVKLRANVPGVDDLEVAHAIEDAGADYLHIDAMKPGHNTADYELVRSIRDATDIFIIGNNSIVDLESARKMLAAGADGISIARAAMSGILKFDLKDV